LFLGEEGLGYYGSGLFNLRIMDTRPLFVTFDRPWFPSDDIVDGLLSRLDMGEHISISKLQKACIKEGRKFKIKVV
jgi:hypothetical protein